MIEGHISIVDVSDGNTHCILFEKNKNLEELIKSIMGNLYEHNKKLFSSLGKLQQNGKTIIMITHDTSSTSLCDVCIELKK